MAAFRTCHGSQGGTPYDYISSFGRRNDHLNYYENTYAVDSRVMNCNIPHNTSEKFSGNIYDSGYAKHSDAPSLKKRKLSYFAWEGCWNEHQQANLYDQAPSIWDSSIDAPAREDTNAFTSISNKRDRSNLDDVDDADLLSRDEIERCSPSRKDGIDVLWEKRLRYSYCAFIQNLGLRLELPQTTIGTAMVLCHRFFVCRSHASHDRFLIATAALFLAAKYEETPCPLNNVLQTSYEILHKQDLMFMSCQLSVDWFEQHREQALEAEQLILTTLNFELNVQHPYVPLTSVLDKLGLSHSVLVNLALSLISEGLRSSLWLQFRPHQIAAGAAFLAAKFLNWDLASYHTVLQEFQTTPAVLQEVEHQLVELF